MRTPHRRPRGPRTSNTSRTRHSPARERLITSLTAVALGLGSSAAWAAFTATTSNPSSAWSIGVPDTTAPAVARTTVARTASVPASSIAAGRYRQNAGYRVYAQVTDAVGVTSVTTNPTAIGGGTTTTAMTPGSYTVAGQTYNYATTTLTAADVTATGVTKTYTVAAADAAANTTTTPTQNATAETYAQAIASTATVVGHWPLGSTTGAAAATLSSDAFTNTAGTDLTAHTAGGVTWTQVDSNMTPVIVRSGSVSRVRPRAGLANLRASTVIPTADYRVAADIVPLSDRDGDKAGVIGRNASGANHYLASYESTLDDVVLRRCTDGVGCDVAAFADYGPLTTTTRIALEMQGTRVRVFMDDRLVIDALQDALWSGPGRGGIMLDASGTAPSDTTGLHLDDYAVTSLDARTTPSVTGSAPAGAVQGGALLNQVGAIADDTGTAIGLDGLDDGVLVPRNAGNGHLVKDDLTLEAWFRSTASTAGVTPWYHQPNIIDATALGGDGTIFGTGLRSSGQVTGGVATTSTVTLVTTPTTPRYDAATGWHHVVLTRVRSTGVVILYVDGVQVSTGTGNTESLTNSDELALGMNALGDTMVDRADQSLNGALDEAAVYSSALTAAQVADHYAAGTGTG